MRIEVWRAVALTALVSVGSGCERSALKGDEPVELAGQLKGTAGAPLASQQVKLYRSGARVDGGRCVIVLTSPDSPYKTVLTDLSGRFEVQMSAAETQTSAVLGGTDGGDLARCFRLFTTDQFRRSVSADFTFQISSVAAPALQLWDAAVSTQVSGDGNALEVTWRGLAEAVEVTPTAQTLELTVGEEKLWTKAVSADSESAVVGLYLVEDFQPAVQISATSEARGSGTIFAVRHASESLAVTTAGPLPPSRGSSCSLGTPCPLTDGKLANVPLSGPSVTFTLSAPVQPTKAVLRNLNGNGVSLVSVEGSTDGVQFTQLGQAVFQPMVEIPLTAASAVTHVRITAINESTDAEQFSSVSEISIWP